MSIGPSVAVVAGLDDGSTAHYLGRVENLYAAWANGELWSPDGAPDYTQGFYYDRLNQWRIKTSFSNQDKVMIVDPLIQDDTLGGTDYITPTIQNQRYILGVYNPLTDIQPVYHQDGGDGDRMKEIDVADMSDLDTWPFSASAQSTVANTGYSTLEDGNKTEGLGKVVVFEDWGFYVQPGTTGVIGGVSYPGVLGKVRLSDGFWSPLLEDAAAGEIEGFVTKFENAPNKYTLGRKNSIQFTLFSMQYVPDIGDSNYLAANPKGQLVFFTTDKFGGTGGPGLEDGGVVKVYVKFTDFNPNGVVAPPGGIKRVHGRQTLFTRFTVIEESRSSAGGIGLLTQYFHHLLSYLPLSSKLVMATREFGGPQARHISVPVAVILDHNTVPTPVGQPETAKTVEFKTRVLGDLGERISGQNVSWVLKRGSTIDEALDTTGLQDPAPAVAHIPIDVGAPLTVKRQGEALTEGVDYSVTESTGVVDWLGAHPDLEAGYTITYEHATNPQLPPHGNLRTTVSSSDANGISAALVEYADDDDLVGHKEVILATTI